MIQDKIPVSSSTKRKSVMTIAKLKQEVDELKQVVDKLLETIEENKKVDLKQKKFVDDFEIRADSYIKIMSLCSHTLNLSTKAGNLGKTFTFEKFGEVKRILYGDLQLIMERHRNFLRNGLFIILNEEVIRNNGLDEAYESILTKENIDKILSGNESDAVTLLKIANPKQQQIIVQLFTDKILNGEVVEHNFLHRLSGVVGFSIEDRAKDIKAQISASQPQEIEK